MNYQGVLYAIIEIVALILLGQMIKRTNKISQDTSKELNDLVFGILFPINIAMGFYQVDVGQYMSGDFLLYNIIVMGLHLVLVQAIVWLLIKDSATRVSVANASYRGNFIIMSTPILTALFGDSALALIGLLVGLSQFYYNFYTVGLYESLDAQGQSKIQTAKSVITNPLVIGVFAGLILYVTKINIYFLEGPLRKLGSLASPLALLNLGYSLDFSLDRSSFKEIGLVSVLKLLVLPISAIYMARFFDLTHLQRVVSVVLYGAPSAVNTFVFAKKYQVKVSLAGYFVLATTIFYTFTIFLVLYMV